MFDNHLYTERFQHGLNFPEPFKHETVMALVGFGPVLGETEEHDDGFSKLVGRSDGVFEGMIVLDALCGLHPVKHVPSVADLLVVQNFYSFLLNHGLY